jgi:flagellin-specific chaperone FliS
MSDIPPKNAIASYSNTKNLEVDSHKAMTRLIEKVIFYVLYAKDAYVAKNLESMADLAGKALEILAHIRVTLREENLNTEDPEVYKIAGGLSNFYRDIYVRMANVLLTKDVIKEYDDILKIMREHHKVWTQPLQGEAPKEEPIPNPPTSSNDSTFYA